MHAVPHISRSSGSLTFAEAVRLCHQVADDPQGGQGGHAVVVADGDDEIVAKAVFDDGFCLDHAVGWAAGFHHAAGSSAALLISSVRTCVQCIDPLLLWEFERSRRMLRALDIELRDWLTDDGYATRSMAYTASPRTAWLGEPTHLRRTRLDRPDPGLVDQEDHDVA